MRNLKIFSIFLILGLVLSGCGSSDLDGIDVKRANTAQQVWDNEHTYEGDKSLLEKEGLKVDEEVSKRTSYTYLTNETNNIQVQYDSEGDFMYLNVVGENNKFSFKRNVFEVTNISDGSLEEFQVSKSDTLEKVRTLMNEDNFTNEQNVILEYFGIK